MYSVFIQTKFVILEKFSGNFFTSFVRYQQVCSQRFRCIKTVFFTYLQEVKRKADKRLLHLKLLSSVSELMGHHYRVYAQAILERSAS